VLLPINSEPFVVPTDRDMLPSERRLFVRTHRTCVLGYGRLRDGPAMSVVYYVPTDEDELLISTTAGRARLARYSVTPRSASAFSTSAGPSHICSSTPMQ
jgi:hypothetical protein